MKLTKIETHPKCNNCTRLNLSCNYGMILKWEDDAEEKGIAFGRSMLNKLMRQQALKKNLGPDERKVLTLTQEICSNESIIWVKSYSTYNLFLNTNYHDFTKLYIIDGIDAEDSYQSNFSKLTDALFSNSFSTNIDYNNQAVFKYDHAMEAKLFHYFVDDISPYCVSWRLKSTNTHTSNNPKLNPFLFLIVPLSMQSPILYYAIMATSARQLALLGNGGMDALAKYYLSEVLKLLPELIKNKSLATSSEEWDEVLATVVLLCLIEISCGKYWLIHLDGAKEFLNQHRTTAPLTMIGLFSSQYFVMQEVLGETVWYTQTNNDTPEYRVLQQYKYNEDANISILMGCSPSLLSIIHQITQLGHKLELLDDTTDIMEVEEAIIDRRNSLELDLANLNQQLPAYGLYEDEIENIKKIAEIRRLTSLIYLFVRIDIEYFYRHRVSDNDVKSNSSYNGRIKRIQRLSDNIVRLIVSLPASSPALLWTLFVLGIVSTNSEEQRWWLLNKLNELEQGRELGNVKTVRFIIETLWKEKDLDCMSNRWLEMLKGKGLGVSLA